jgi:hypothetical protein
MQQNQDVEHALALPWAVGEQPPPPPPGLPPQLEYDHNMRFKGTVIAAPKNQSMLDELIDSLPGLRTIGKACLVPIFSVFIVIAWVIGQAGYAVLLCFGVFPDPAVDEAKDELRVYSSTHFGCRAEDLNLAAPRKAAVLPNPHLARADSVISSSPDAKTSKSRTRSLQRPSDFVRGSILKIMHKSNEVFFSKQKDASGEESPDDEDDLPELVVPSFTAGSQDRWLRWASDLGYTFQSIMKGVKSPDVAEKEEHIAEAWAENQWNHWQRSCDRLIVHDPPQVAYEERLMAVKEVLKDSSKRSLAGMQNYAMATSIDISESKKAGQRRYCASQGRLHQYEELLNERLNQTVVFDELGRPLPPPAAPPPAPYPATLKVKMKDQDDDVSRDGTLKPDKSQVGVRRSSSMSMSSAPFAFRRSVGMALE